MEREYSEWAKPLSSINLDLDQKLPPPAPRGQKYRNFQIEAIIAARDMPNLLLADEMGVGKCIEAIGIVNDSFDIRKVLVVCPASLRLNWRRELMTWLTRRDMTIGIATHTRWPLADIVVCSYESLKPLHRNIHAVEWDMAICDEAHYLKSQNSNRTLEVIGRESKDPIKRRPKILAKRWVLMTGTPIVNRPYELWPLVHHLAPDTFKSKNEFISKYCGGRKRNQKLSDIGTDSMLELHGLLKSTVMIRRLKQDVLPELPPKTRQLILFPDDTLKHALTKERAAYRAVQQALSIARLKAELAKTVANEAVYIAAVKELREAEFISIQQITKIRFETAMLKVPLVIEHIHYILEHVEKVVVFAHHTAVVETIALEFGEAVVTITGKHDTGKRQAAIDRFQTDPKCKVFVGSIEASGVGHTLTAAQVALFAELTWTPSSMTQAEDRLHRMGQKNHVLVQHLVLDQSIDAMLAQRIIEKQETINAVMDPVSETKESLYSLAKALPFVDDDRTQILETANNLSQEEINAIHDTLIDALKRGRQKFNQLDLSIIQMLAELEYLEPAQASLGYAILVKYSG